jgi:hypothetical protein
MAEAAGPGAGLGRAPPNAPAHLSIRSRLAFLRTQERIASTTKPATGIASGSPILDGAGLASLMKAVEAAMTDGSGRLVLHGESGLSISASLHQASQTAPDAIMLTSPGIIGLRSRSRTKIARRYPAPSDSRLLSIASRSCAEV